MPAKETRTSSGAAVRWNGVMKPGIRMRKLSPGLCPAGCTTGTLQPETIPSFILVLTPETGNTGDGIGTLFGIVPFLSTALLKQQLIRKGNGDGGKQMSSCLGPITL